jgi:hypothetical protein
MTITKRIPVIALMLAITLATASVSSSQQEKFDRARMQRDIDIMESILVKLIQGNGGRWSIFEEKVQGLYLANYGVLFYLPQGMMHVMHFPDRMQFKIQALSDLEGELAQVEAELQRLGVNESAVQAEKVARQHARIHGQKEKEIDAESDDTSQARYQERIKDGIIEFLSNYADAIGQVRPTDRVAVLVDLRSNAMPVLGTMTTRLPRFWRVRVNPTSCNIGKAAWMRQHLLNAFSLSKARLKPWTCETSM